MTATLEELRGRGVLSPLDDRFARSMTRLASDECPEVLLAAALASRQAARGDVCVDLPSLVEAADLAGDGEAVGWPPLAPWLERLSASPLVATGADSATTTPLVLDGSGRLYLRRLWEHEQRLAQDLMDRARPAEDPADSASVRASIERLLPAPAGERRIAVAIAAARRLCVISGLPGSGKTTTAAQLLAVLVERALNRGLPAPRIALAAPTGKAAARLAAAINRARGEMNCAPEARAAIPREATTLHRLLRMSLPGRPGRAPVDTLRADVVVVDEASMVDLEMATRLVEALPSQAKLILLGDPDQLASVEAGSVFADLCGPQRVGDYSDEMASWLVEAAGEPARAGRPGAAAMRDCVATLTSSHRYGDQSGIGALARAIQSGDAPRALQVLADDAFPDARLVPPGANSEVRDAIVRGYAPFGRAALARTRLQALSLFRVLCAVREGPFGVEALNREAEAALVQSGALAPVPRGAAGWGVGRPILVNRNAPHLGLYNGDVGVTDPGGDAQAFFEAGDNQVHGFGIARLPACEPVFAMTVHKSQGSEFDEVALVLPNEPIPLLTRELVYTAVTRARHAVVIHARPEVLSAAIARRTARVSGLREALWGASG
ncbi:MAG: exodeoxyribonuclease V subunit alpha [Myxococcota bacterium]|nr:exodeoxyribonuclease V subunit alpha [Myxococcota bacterium]